MEWRVAEATTIRGWLLRVVALQLAAGCRSSWTGLCDTTGEAHVQDMYFAVRRVGHSCGRAGTATACAGDEERVQRRRELHGASATQPSAVRCAPVVHLPLHRGRGERG